MSQQKGSKHPKPAVTNTLDPSAIFGGTSLEVSAELQEHFKSINHGYKWLNTDRLKLTNGVHPRGWVPYRLPKEVQAKLSRNPFSSQDPEFLIVGDLVLGSKPLTGSTVSVENHKRFLAQKIEIETTGIGNMVDAQGNRLFGEEK